MNTKFQQIAARELFFAVMFVLAAAGWYVSFQWVIPFIYSVISRFGSGDYSYLWNGFSENMKALSSLGIFLIVLGYPLFLSARLFRRACGPRALPGPQPDEKGLGEVIFNELMTVALILLLAGCAFFFSQKDVLQLKEKYFIEVVVNKDGYKKLSSSEKAKVREQYDQMNPQAAVAGMIRDYGFRARGVYYVQVFSFWAVVFAWPGLWLVRFLAWVGRKINSDGAVDEDR